METIIIQPKTKADLKLLKVFLSKTKIQRRVLSNDKKEDILLSQLMQEVDITDTVDTEKFLKKLRSN